MLEIAGVYRASSRELSRLDDPRTGRFGQVPLGEALQVGQLLELSGQAPGKLSLALRWVLRAQVAGEPVAWIGLRHADSFYPPDVAETGVDLSALVLVRLSSQGTAHALVRAAELLLRSGAFGLVVVDLERGVPRGELAWQSRLSGLARMHGARVVLLTRASAQEASLGPLVSLRVEAAGEPRGRHMALVPRLLKSKLGTSTALSPDVRSLPRGAR
jgi:RecA/RadA recombinase